MPVKLLLGYDIGSSSIKASLINADTGELAASASSPEQEMKIESPVIGWAEQDPETWWLHVINATKKMLGELSTQSFEIAAIGISYQMHGLVLVDKHRKVLRPSIIWCDSRAVEIGNKAFSTLGADYCLSNYLNSPGNFTASKLKWVKDNEPEIYSRIYKIMLPGDYVGMKLTGSIYTTLSGLSEGVLWNFSEMNIADKLLKEYGINSDLIAEVAPTFGIQGYLNQEAADQLGLKTGVPVCYRAGDQPNNALSLNVLNPGEIAATAGTSGVIYGVAGENIYDKESRVNTFAHVNYTEAQPNVGVLLCINGTGIQYSWLRNAVMDSKYSYTELNEMASQVNTGADGLLCYPFGNGAERMLKNKDIGGHFSGLNFNVHGKGHLIRAAQEGIAFSFRYGLDIMKDSGMEFNVVRAGNANLFQSPIFRDAFVNTCKVNLELYNTDGSQGAARGAGIGAGVYNTPEEAFSGLKIIGRQNFSDAQAAKYDALYNRWKTGLDKLMNE